MDADLKEFIINKAVMWFEQMHGHKRVIAVIDENEPAEVYGENVLAWYVELIGDALSMSFGVEVAIDPDGYISVNRIEPTNLRLKHLWPHT